MHIVNNKESTLKSHKFHSQSQKHPWRYLKTQGIEETQSKHYDNAINVNIEQLMNISKWTSKQVLVFYIEGNKQYKIKKKKEEEKNRINMNLFSSILLKTWACTPSFQANTLESRETHLLHGIKYQSIINPQYLQLPRINHKFSTQYHFLLQ